MGVTFKILYVRNLDATVTSTDLTKLFNFNATSFLRRHTCVQITEEGEERVAKVVAPEDVQVELLKLNGVEFYGKQLVIEAEADPDESTTETVTDNINNSNDDDDNSDILYMLLDCRNYPDLNFNPVKEVEVCAALQLDHADYHHKAVKTFWGEI